MDAAAAALALEGVSRRFGDVVAVDDVSFTVAPGEFVTLLGPSGGGKTSTLRIVAGFLRPDGGRVLLGGERVDAVPPYERDIGMVFQSYALFPHMTVHDNVGFGLRMRRVGRREIAERVVEALALVRLDGYGARFPHELSGGQQQRVAIARALVIRPALLLLDEPMSNLDAALRISMQLELRRIVERVRVTTLYVTHNQEEALAMSDRIIVMAEGRVVQVGRPADVYRRPANEFVARFLGRSNLVRCRVTGRDGDRLAAKTERGEIVSVAGVDAAAGDPLLLLVRPELIEIDTPGRTGPNCFQGEIAQVAFMGAYAEYVVEAAGQSYLVHAPEGSRAAGLTAGTRVTLHWKPSCGVALREGAAPAAPTS